MQVNRVLRKIKTLLRRRKIETRIVVIILVSLFLLVSMGIFSYRFLNGVLNEVLEEVGANEEVTTIKNIQQDFANVELANLSFKIYGDSAYFANYSNRMMELRQHLNTLNSIENSEHPDEFAQYKRLSFVKYSYMDTLMQMELMPNYEKYMTQLKSDISTIPAITENNKFLVGGKKVTQAYLRQSAEVFTKVKTLLLQIKEQRQHAYAELNLKLTELTDTLNACAEKIAAIKQNNTLSKGDVANNKLFIVKWIIIVFCVLAGCFLIFLIYIIVGYLKKNAISGKMLRLSKEKAESLAQAKEEFLANMSHEIRTPLNAIVGFSDQLVKSNLSPGQQEQMHIIKQSSDHLLHIVNEILDFSKMNQGALKLENVPFNAIELVEEVAAMMRSKASEKNLQLTVEINTEISDLLGDPVRVRQIMLNLVSNAIKFTEKGGVSIHLDKIKGLDNKTELIIQVEDSGIGIPKEKIEKVFNMFEQAETDTTRKYGGTGLGLSICKRIVDVYGGSISVDSEVGQGTTFSVILPFEEAKTNSKLKQTSPILIQPEQFQQFRILIVDDQEFNRKLLSTLFKNWKIRFTTLDDGLLVMDELLESLYDLILMDIRMPGMDGISTTKAIRSHSLKEISSIPIIGVTAAITPDDKSAGIEAGMNGFLTKPFTEEKLFALLEQFLTPDSSKQVKTTEDDALDIKELEGMSGGDKAFIVEMLEVYIQSSNDGLAKIKAALSEKNTLEIREQAHKIASPNKHIGAKQLYQELKNLEQAARNNFSINDLSTLYLNIENHYHIIAEKVNAKIEDIKNHE